MMIYSGRYIAAAWEVDVDGTPFGRYRLVELLGQGGMGEVWRAFDTATHRVVAVKVLPVHLANDREFQQRFRREALAAASLTEPHVVPIHDFGEIDGRLYVDMRLIEGRDLHTVLRDGPLQPPRAVRIIEQIAAALHAAHRIGLSHRDVKPSNILIAEDDFAYLIDFGIARHATDTELTATGAVVGTWTYLAPERLTGGIADARADVYALTCVLYQCLTARTPYPGEGLEQQVTAHLTVEPPKPSDTNPAIPTAFNEVIARGMAKDPEQRYQTARELATAASQVLTDPLTAAPTDAQPTMAASAYPGAAPSIDTPPATPGGRRLSRRTTIALATVATVAFVAVVAVVVAVFLGRQSPGGAVSSPTSTTTSASTSTTPTRGTAAPAVADLSGAWNGRASYGTDVELIINSPNKLDGTITYNASPTSRHCVETWTETGRNGNTIQVQERGGPPCDNANFDVTIDGIALSAKSTWVSGGQAYTLMLVKKNISFTVTLTGHP
jgi:serine/threonine protein kinase